MVISDEVVSFSPAATVEPTKMAYAWVSIDLFLLWLIGSLEKV